MRIRSLLDVLSLFFMLLALNTVIVSHDVILGIVFIVMGGAVVYLRHQ